jgi:hypothetical protein
MRVQEDVSTILVPLRGFRISSELDIPCEQSNFGSHVNFGSIVGFEGGDVSVIQGKIESKHRFRWVGSVNRNNGSLIS